jgi:hypothetical protein
MFVLVKHSRGTGHAKLACCQAYLGVITPLKACRFEGPDVSFELVQ